MSPYRNRPEETAQKPLPKRNILARSWTRFKRRWILDDRPMVDHRVLWMRDRQRKLGLRPRQA